MIYAWIFAVGGSYALSGVWWIPFLVALVLLFLGNEAKVQRRRLEFEREWRLREDLFKAGDRRPR